MPKNAQTTAQLHSSHTLVKLAFSLLRNLYEEQEATVRTLNGTTGWFKIWKAVHQGCIYCYPACLTYVQGT